MTEAKGIHAHPTMKLGRRPADPTKPKLRLASFLKAVPDHPIIDKAPPLNYPMDHNDEAGDCVVAGWDHTRQVIKALLTGVNVNYSDDQILKFYQTQNPNFKSWADSGGRYDEGMVIQDFLSYLTKQGEILGFAAVDPANEDEVKAAIYLGLAIITGEDLQTAQQSQTIWDYHHSADWGGHCTTWVGYKGSPDYDTCVTWGGLTDMTQAFVRNQVSEAWFVITKDHVDHPGFRSGFDIAKFAQAYKDITGRDFPVTVNPEPTPTPVPVPPAPGGDNSFREACKAYPGLVEKLDKLAARNKQLSIKDGEHQAAWALAKSYGFR
jgi:hypothetical protein